MPAHLSMLMYFFSISSYSNAGTMVLDQGKVGMAGGLISRIQKRRGGTALDGGRRREGEGEREKRREEVRRSYMRSADHIYAHI